LAREAITVLDVLGWARQLARKPLVTTVARELSGGDEVSINK